MLSVSPATMIVCH